MFSLALVAGTAHAYTADLSLTGRQSGQVITQTRTQTLELEITNLGPDAAPNVRVVNRLGFPPDVLVTVSPGCAVTTAPSEFDPTWTVYRWEAGDIAAGERKTCTFTFQARPTARNITFAPGQLVEDDSARTDPDPFNDQLTLPAFVVSAIDFITDVSVSVRYGPSILGTASRGTMTVSATNLGPDAAPRVVILTSYLYGAAQQIRLFGLPGTTCTIFFEDVGTQLGGLRTAIISLGSIAAGQTASCTFGIETSATAVGSLPLSFRANNGGFGVFDPDLSNNVTGVILLFTALPVPATSALGMFALAVIVVIAVMRARRSVTQRV